MKVSFQTILICVIALPLFLSRNGRAHPPENPGAVHAMHSTEDAAHHDPSFDQDMFLGSERAAEFRKLSPEQSKERLRLLIKKVDADGDGKVTEEELKKWVEKISFESTEKEVDRQWASGNKDGHDELELETYRNNMYGPHEVRDKDPEHGDRYRSMLKRDTRRFKAADVDGNGKLSQKEFSAFVYGENHKHMEEAVSSELLESVDSDQDGKISLQEYIADIGKSMGASEEQAKVGSEWAKRFEDEFKRSRDKDGDGYLTMPEVKEWVAPEGYDAHDAEAKHLIYYADKNKDGHLTEEEILANAELFAGSSATEYGKALQHEEL